VKRPAKGQAPGGEGARLSAWGYILDRRPILIAVAGPNGAGKTTFYHAHLRPAGLRFINADEMARGLAIEAYEAARVVAHVRQESQGPKLPSNASQCAFLRAGTMSLVRSSSQDSPEQWPTSEEQFVSFPTW